jgi:hypothetical protein
VFHPGVPQITLQALEASDHDGVLDLYFFQTRCVLPALWLLILSSLGTLMSLGVIVLIQSEGAEIPKSSFLIIFLTGLISAGWQGALIVFVDKVRLHVEDTIKLIPVGHVVP